ncbi:unnamed protein product [Boreogadus saida]
MEPEFCYGNGSCVRTVIPCCCPPHPLLGPGVCGGPHGAGPSPGVLVIVPWYDSLCRDLLSGCPHCVIHSILLTSPGVIMMGIYLKIYMVAQRHVRTIGDRTPAHPSWFRKAFQMIVYGSIFRSDMSDTKLFAE